MEREAGEKKARVTELEQRIAAAEQQVKAIEARMAEPGFYEDRDQAEGECVVRRRGVPRRVSGWYAGPIPSQRVVKERETLMWQVGDLLG